MSPCSQHERVPCHERLSVRQIRSRVTRFAVLDLQVRKLEPEVTVGLKEPVHGQEDRTSKFDVVREPGVDPLVIDQSNEQPPGAAASALPSVDVMRDRI